MTSYRRLPNALHTLIYYTSTTKINDQISYRAKNGTFKRVPQMAQDNSQNQGGMVRCCRRLD